MSETTRLVHAPRRDVWEVLEDGWLYPLFVVGASRMRDVDEGWPAVGTRLHHSVGLWPLLIDDHTDVLEVSPPDYLRLEAHAWPGGTAEVEFVLEERGDETLVRIREDAVSGPGKLLPSPLRQPPLHWRNTETLRRLAYLAERRVGARGRAAP